MTFDWAPLHSELRLWRQMNLELPLWWRDDDAIAATPQLERLSKLADDAGLPVHVAVVPALIKPTLPPVFLNDPNMVPVIHGWRHISHAPEGAKNAEFGHPRAAAQDELAQAMSRMGDHFGDRLVKLFVPPWNRISDDLFPVLAAETYAGVSTFGPRTSIFPVPTVMQINTHIDPIFWRGHRGLVDPDILIAGIAATLRERREGGTDSTEPLGLLTHHLVHTEDIWRFTRDVLAVLLDGGAVPADLRQILQYGRRSSI